MASSLPEETSICEFCETDANIPWRCVQCNKFMCNKCKKIHLNVLTTIQHDIVSSSDVVEHKFITNNVPCTRHKKKFVFLFCKTCDELICMECISSSHKKHELEIIETTCDEKVKLSKASISHGLIHCHIETLKLAIREDVYTKGYDNALKNIDETESKLKEAIEKYADEQRQKIQLEMKSRQDFITEKKHVIKETEQSIKQSEVKLNAAIESKMAAKVIGVASEIGKDIPDLVFKDFPGKTYDFSIQRIDPLSLSHLFGSLKQTDVPDELCPIFEIMRNFSFDSRVLKIQDDNKIWSKNSESNILSQYEINVKGQVAKIKEIAISGKIFQMALTPSNDILLCMGDKSIIKLVSQAGIETIFITLAPLFPHGIHVTIEGFVIVGVSDTENEEEKSNGKLIIFSMDGSQKQTFQFDEQTNKLFHVPRCITTNVNNDILIIDRIGQYSGRIVALKNDGAFRWTYKGNPRINILECNCPFDPYDIVTTHAGLVIVADCYSHYIHILSCHGKFLTYSNEFLYPIFLDIDSSGRLWVSNQDSLTVVKICTGNVAE